MLISKIPNRHLTLCHIIGVFVHRNFILTPDALSFDTPAPRPLNLDINCLMRAGVVHEEDAKYEFYEPGETLKEMRNLSRAEVNSARKLEKRLAKLEDIERKLEEIKEVIYKTRKSQIQMLMILNHNQIYQGDSFNVVRSVIISFMGRVWSMAKARLPDGDLEEDPDFNEEVGRTLDAKVLKLR